MFIFKLILLIFTILNIICLLFGEVSKATIIAELYFMAVVIALIF